MAGTGSTAPAGAGEDLLGQHRGETVLITGASSGIGRELARQFAGDGADLVLIARGEDRLRELAAELAAESGVTVEVVPADLARPGSPGQIVQTPAQRQIEVDVLVNNAGFGARGPVAGIGAGRQLDMIEVNVAALTRLTALLLPAMLERRRGGILNVASTAAFQPGPNSAVYDAAKAYVLSFTEALAEEVRGSGVRVSCLAPGPTDTGFAAQAGATGSRLFRRGVMDAGRVARAGHDGLRRVRPWSFPACVTGPWRLARACPRASLPPRSPATCRHKRRPAGFAAPRPGPAAANPAVTGRAGPVGYLRHQVASHHATQSALAQDKAHTAADLYGCIIGRLGRPCRTRMGIIWPEGRS